MAVDSKFFNIPFATSGDKTTIPEAVQPSGAISFTQGFGPDYERDPATDPLAKRVPRDETNELYYEITLALKYLQLYGTPQYTAVADGGPANYPLSARVRYDAGAGMQVWRSVVATNTAVPGADATKWALDDTVGEASLAQALAGAIGGVGMTPRRTASAAQQNPWNSATATGTTALVVTLAPAPAAYTKFLPLDIQVPNDATGASTINVNGLGAKAVVDKLGNPVVAKFWRSGDILTLIYDGTSFRVVGGNSQITPSLASQNTATTAVGNNVLTQIPLTATTASFGSIASNQLTFTRAGVYLISLTFSTSEVFTGPTNVYSTMSMRKNNVEIPGGYSQDGNYGVTSTVFTLAATLMTEFAVGDVFTALGTVAAGSGFTSASFTGASINVVQIS